MAANSPNELTPFLAAITLNHVFIEINRANTYNNFKFRKWAAYFVVETEIYKFFENFCANGNEYALYKPLDHCKKGMMCTKLDSDWDIPMNILFKTRD